jgi:exonuclease VII small subunit
MNFVKLLTKISSELEAYNTSAFDDSILEGYVLALEAINDDLNDATTDYEFALYNQCEAQVEVAERFFEDVYRQEEIDQELDERQYASYEQLQ